MSDKDKSQQESKSSLETFNVHKYVKLENNFSELEANSVCKNSHLLFLTAIFSNINSKKSLFLVRTDVNEIQILIRNFKMKFKNSLRDIPSKFWEIASCVV